MFLSPIRQLAIAASLCAGVAMAQAPAPAPAPALPSGPSSGDIRALAASCANCHGTNGKATGAVPALAGLPREAFIQKMNAYRTGPVNSTIMFRHAKGLTEAEIAGLADFFSKIK